MRLQFRLYFPAVTCSQRELQLEAASKQADNLLHFKFARRQKQLGIICVAIIININDTMEPTPPPGKTYDMLDLYNCNSYFHTTYILWKG